MSRVKSEILRIENACKTHSIEDVFNINLNLFKGEILGLILRNSSLENTLFDILSGSTQMDSGSYYIDDIPQHFDSIHSAIQAGVYSISRTMSHLIPSLSIMENISVIYGEGSLVSFIDTKRVEEETEKLLARYKLKNLSAKMLPKNLTPATWHIIEVLKAVRLRTRVLVIGNIFAQYSQRELSLFLGLMEKIASEDISVIFFANKFSDYVNIADRVTIIRNGTTIADIDNKPFDEQLITTILAGKPLMHKDHSQPQVTDKAILQVQNLDDNKYLKNLNFKLYKGEVLGILDMNGFYGNSLANVLVSQAPCTCEVTVGDSHYKVENSLFPNIDVGLISESDNLIFQNLSLHDNITLNIPKDLGGSLLAPSRTRINTYLYRETLKQLHSESLIEEYGNCKKLPVLKKEDQMRIQVAKWVFSGVEVLIMINPGIRFDATNHCVLKQLISDICSLGISIIVVSANISSMQGICSRIIEIDEIAKSF